MKRLDFTNANGFVVDLTNRDDVVDIYCDTFNESKYFVSQQIDTQTLRNRLIGYYTNNYDYVFIKAPNVYQIVEGDLFYEN